MDTHGYLIETRGAKAITAVLDVSVLVFIIRHPVSILYYEYMLLEKNAEHTSAGFYDLEYINNHSIIQ